MRLICFFLKTPLGPDIYVTELIFKHNFKTLFFLMRTFDVSKITKNPFYTPLILIESQNPKNSMKKYINTAYGTKK